MKGSLALGRIFFGLAVVGSGVQQLCRQECVRLVPKGHADLATSFWWPAVISGLVLVAAGLAILANRKRRPAGITMVALLMLVLALYWPDVSAQPGRGFVWTNPAKTLALIGGAALLAGISTSGSAVNTVDRRAWWIGAGFFSLFLALGGVQHFVYADFVANLVPAWIPPGQIFWTWFTGIALLTGGVGLLIPPTARIAAMSVATMILLWVVLLHIPRALANPQDPGETSAIFEALALSGVGWLLAGTVHRAGNPDGTSRRATEL